MHKKKTDSETIKLQKQIKELKTGWQRTQADFENYRKRIESEKLENLAWAKAEFTAKLTPVLDNFSRALDHKPMSTYEVEFNRYISGIKQIAKQLEDILLEEGLRKIPAEPGTQFDPRYHEAISYEENDLPADSIISELQSGWKFENRVIKPAKVRVSKGITKTN